MLLSLAILSLSSCVSSETANRDLSYGTGVVKVVMPDDTYRVYQHPTDNSLKVTPSLARVAGIGAAQGFTLGLADEMTPEARLEAAARKFLDDTGRSHCAITRGYLLHKPVFEFWYECAQT